MPDLMIDIETMGTSTGAAILQIGAVFFDRQTCQPLSQFQTYISPPEAAVLDIETVLWWMKQPDAARQQLISGVKQGLSEPDALWELIHFIKDNGGAPNAVWAQGQDFDFGHLKSAFERQHITPPWRFWTARDTRTVFDVMGLNYKKESALYFKQHPEMAAHNATADCIAQIHCLGLAIKGA